jgi:hypothetical protein
MHSLSRTHIHMPFSSSSDLSVFSMFDHMVRYPKTFALLLIAINLPRDVW